MENDTLQRRSAATVKTMGNDHQHSFTSLSLGFHSFFFRCELLLSDCLCIPCPG